MRVRSVVASLVLTAIWCSSGGASPGTPAASKTTRLAVVRGTVEAFAQDGPRLAWIREDARCGERVVLFDLRTRRRVSLEDRKGPSCTFAGLFPTIAIGGSRVVWESSLGEATTERRGRVVTAAANDRRNRPVGELDMVSDLQDDYDFPPPLVAGDGGTLVFYGACETEACGPRAAWSGVRRIVGGKAHRLLAVDRPLALAAAGSKVAALEDLYPCPCNYGPRWSPDGSRIAWSRKGAIYVMNADGSEKRRVGSAASPASPRWSPGGTALAYEHHPGSGAPSEVRVVGADGSGDRRLTAGSRPEWSPSGRKLSFVRGGDVWTIDSDGGGARRLTNDARAGVGGAEWSPDGTRLVAAGAKGLYVIGADGTGATRIVRESTARSAPRWSPDGSRIAWTRGERVAAVGADGSGLRDLAEGANPAWSPDGTWIAFDRATEGDSTVFVVPSAGGAATGIDLPNRHAAGPSWSPDGRSLAVGDSADAEYHDRRSAGIYAVAPDGSAPRKLAPADQTAVAVRDVRTGAGTGSFVVHGDAYAMALSRSFVAVLVKTETPGKSVLEIHRLRTGAVAAAIRVAAAPAFCTGIVCSYLAVSDGGTAVFRVGNRIGAFDLRTRSIRTIATTRTTPIGLSIEGRRVAWAESRSRSSVVKAVVLPA